LEKGLDQVDILFLSRAKQEDNKSRNNKNVKGNEDAIEYHKVFPFGSEAFNRRICVQQCFWTGLNTIENLKHWTQELNREEIGDVNGPRDHIQKGKLWKFLQSNHNETIYGNQNE
jgi:hypothetical protein